VDFFQTFPLLTIAVDFFQNLPLLARVAISILLVFGLYVHIFNFNTKYAIDGPAIFTTGGIFFTFVGIAIGLLNFDVNNVVGSVPALLGGLKTAFIASVFGVAIALTIKLRYAIFGIPLKNKEADTYGTTIEDLLKQLVGIQQALVGDDDSTLLSQIKLGRSDTNDRLDSLRKSQQEFMEKMADNNSKALIQALQEVIRDFNTKINEQFGDNFKQLNAAVEKILVWQESYRQQMSEMIEQQKKTAQNMHIATERYEALVTNAERYGAISDQLAKLLEGLNIQRNQMEHSLKSLGELLTTASSSLPQVEKKIMELTQQMTYGVKMNQDEITRTLRDTSTVLQNTIGDIKKLLVDAVQSSNQEFNGHITQITTKTKEQVAALDVALDRELTKSLETLARQLTALSQRFVEDYMPLTERLRQIVNMVKGV
jgi:ABC-type transporter Mla subunit MlaD